MIRLSTVLLSSTLALCWPGTGCAQSTNPPSPLVQTPNGPAVQGPSSPKGAVEEGGSNAWFDKTRLDLGQFYDEEEATGTFQFKNPRSVPHKLTNLQPSCSCSKAIVRLGDRKYLIGSDKLLYRLVTKDGAETQERVTHINVDPGQTGELEVHMAMAGIRGPKEASLNIQTSDEDLPVMNLSWHAVGAQFFNVEPPEVNLNEMAWGDKRDFEFRVTSPMRPDFQLLDHDKLSTGLTVQTEKTMQDGKAVWRVFGSYGPDVEERDSGGTINFKTDIDGKQVSMRVVAYIKGPLTMKPGGFLAFGSISKDQGKSMEVVLSPNGDFDLQVTDLKMTRLSGLADDQHGKVELEHHKDGKDQVVTIKVDPGVKPGTYITGLVKIALNHPAVKEKEVMFNGFVR